MVHRPGLLFLDEPSTGLDPQNRANLKDHIERLRSEHGTTMVLTTHYLDEADSLADRVVVVDHGRIIADDTPERLKSELVGDRMVITAIDETDAAAGSRPPSNVVSSRGQPSRSMAPGHGPSTRPARCPELLRTLDAGGICVATAEVARPTLDDVFLALTGRSLRESAVAAEAGPDATRPPTEPRSKRHDQ